MKTVKRKILLVIAAVLVLSLSVGFASAYFSDHEAAQGSATIQLGGKTQIVEDWDGNIKKVSIANIGKVADNDTEVIVRVALYGPEGMRVDYNKATWYFDGTYYYYKGILQLNESTPIDDLKASIEGISGELGDSFDIVVIQESAQPTYEYVKVDDNTIKNKVVAPSGWDNMPDIYASEEGGE